MHMSKAELLHPFAEIRRKNVPVLLPEIFDTFLENNPELFNLLHGFAQRDPGTFIHSVTVYLSGIQLLHDLFLRYSYPEKQRKKIQENLPFFLLHDIGKTASHIDPDLAKHRVHPIKGNPRQQEEMAFHWVHPQLSATLIKLWGQLQQNTQTQKKAIHWAQLALLHDEQLNPYLVKSNQELIPHTALDLISELEIADCITMLVFLISDTSVAMGLPRPNRPSVWPEEKLTYVLHQILSKNNRLQTIIPHNHLKSKKEVEQLKHFIIASALSSLKKLQNLFSPEQMQSPTQFHSRHFHTDIKEESVSNAQLGKLIQSAWKKAEPEWLKTVQKMEKNGVFRFG